MSTLVETVTLKVRDMIVGGQLKPGTRVPERDLAQAFDVSRTPVRLALGVLEAEGLVKGQRNRGFLVCDFSEEDILSAFEVRGALEGLAVRSAIERGIGHDTIDVLEGCIAEGNRLIATKTCNAEDMRCWSASNDKFHGAIIAASGLPALTKTHEFMSRMPLVAPIAILFTNNEHDDAYARMSEAHADHVHLFDAISRNESARAEHLMREHAYRSREHLARLLKAGIANGTPLAPRERESAGGELASG